MRAEVAARRAKFAVASEFNSGEQRQARDAHDLEQEEVSAYGHHRPWGGCGDHHVGEHHHSDRVDQGTTQRSHEVLEFVGVTEGPLQEVPSRRRRATERS